MSITQKNFSEETRSYDKIACRKLLMWLCVFQIFVSVPLAFAEDSHHAPAHADEVDSHADSKHRKHSKARSRRPKLRKVREDAPVGGEKKITHKKFDLELSQLSGIDAVLILDASRSMTRTDPFRLRSQGAKLFSRFLGSNDRIAVIEFSDKAKVVFELTGVDANNLTAFDTSIDSVSTEGGFTDLQAPINEALQLLVEQGRPGIVKCVILLSDGKMDPHPNRGTGDELNEELLSVDLPRYKDNNIRLYTLSLSKEADKELLAKLALATDGLHWYAPDVDIVHLKFSDLFLALKKPQMLPLEGEGFEIDGNIDEATFYITREKSTERVSFLDPLGRRIVASKLTPTVKWFKGKLFDVVTIGEPTPGLWRVKGVESPEGYATLLTDVELQVTWAKSNLNVGDRLLAAVRLLDKGEIFETPGLDDITFYNYKILDVKSGMVVDKGSFKDDGKGGDAKEGDKIYSKTIKIHQSGDFKALVGVTTPTFTRQQQIPFTVFDTFIKVSLEPADHDGEHSEKIYVNISEKGLELKKRSVTLLAKKEHMKKVLSLPLTEVEGEEGVYEADPSLLKKGQYEIYARLKGVTRKRSKVSSSSKILVYEAAGKDVSHGDSHSSSGNWFYYLGALSLATVWSGLLGVFSRKELKGKVSEVSPLEAYVIPEAWDKRLHVLRDTVSDDRREPTSDDLAMLKIEGVDESEKDETTEEDESQGESEPAQEDVEESSDEKKDATEDATEDVAQEDANSDGENDVDDVEKEGS